MQRRFLLLLLLILVISSALVVVRWVKPVNHGLKGNQKIEMFGRIVDEQGNPISGARVAMLLMHDPQFKSIVEDPQYQTTIIRVMTDSGGYFVIGPVYGEKCSLSSVKRNEIELIPLGNAPFEVDLKRRPAFGPRDPNKPRVLRYRLPPG